MQVTEQVERPARERAAFGRYPAALAWATLLLLVLAVYLTLSRYEPPAVRGGEVAATEFSTRRAMAHVEALAQRPRPVGSEAHAAARDYVLSELRKLGLAPEVQKVSGVNRRAAENVYTAGTVENVAARLGGTEGGPALLLAAHYDSVSTGPGAGDDASGVAVLLETARAVRSRGTPRHDLIFLFTDAEEPGLLGAQAFAESHAWAGDVGLVLNFEARGRGGPSIMFETSQGNGRLISEFGAAVSRPVASSLAYEIYRRLPNDTDLSVWKRKGTAGLNFGFIEDITHYHTALDTPKNLDGRSLQQHGEAALALAARFAERGVAGVAATNGADAVYFDLLGLGLVRYPVPWVLPLLLVAALLFVALVVRGLRRRLLTAGGLALGFVGALACLCVVPLVVWGGWRLTEQLQAAAGVETGAAVYHQQFYLLSWVLLAVACGAVLLSLLRRKVALSNLAFGGLAWWLLLAALTSLYVPGASYLFVWPLLLSLAAWAWLLFSGGWGEAQGRGALLLLPAALAGVVLFVPAVSLIFEGLGLMSVVVVGVMLALLACLLIPQFEVLSAGRARALPLGAAAACLAVLLYAGYAGGFDPSRPRQVNLFYAMNGDTRGAVWGTFEADEPPAVALAPQLGDGRARGPIADYVPQRHGNFLSHAAPPFELAPPEVTVLEDATEGALRRVRMRVVSRRGAPLVTVHMNSDVPVQGALVGGRRIDLGEPITPSEDQPRWRLQYYGAPPEGFEVTLELKAGQPLQLKAMDHSYGLPDAAGAGATRPASVIPSSVRPYSDQTLVNRSFSF